MDEKAIQAIKDILKRGHDAVIRKKGAGYIILEQKKTIQYTTQRIGVE